MPFPRLGPGPGPTKSRGLALEVLSLGGVAFSLPAGSTGGATSVGGNPRPCTRTRPVRSAMSLRQLLARSSSLAL
eukprot:13914802-Alexandrium_andersonii.AAC.1